VLYFRINGTNPTKEGDGGRTPGTRSYHEGRRSHLPNTKRHDFQILAPKFIYMAPKHVWCWNSSICQIRKNDFLQKFTKNAHFGKAAGRFLHWTSHIYIYIYICIYINIYILYAPDILSKIVKLCPLDVPCQSIADSVVVAEWAIFCHLSPGTRRAGSGGGCAGEEGCGLLVLVVNSKSRGTTLWQEGGRAHTHTTTTLTSLGVCPPC